jgi:hypothetical protein
MDNTVLPYTVETDSSDESDDSDSSHEGNLLSNNLGVLNDKFETKNVRFMNMEKVEDYQQNRNKLFTPKIYKKYFTVSLSSTTDNQPFSLKDTIKLPTDNIIGFKMVKSNFVGNSSDHFVDLTIPEIPEIACDKNESGQTIFSRIPLRKTNDDFYTHQYLELSLIDRYFYPTSFDILTFKLSTALSGFVVIEVTYLNEKVQ